MTNNQPTILVIEDEQSLLEAIKKKLENSGFNTVPASDAEQALSYLESSQTNPDLIWLDYYLPGISGLEFMSKIKNNEKFSAIPIFIISNTAGPDKVSSMMGLGANKYFLKAEKRLDEIIDEIKKYLFSSNNP